MVVQLAFMKRHAHLSFEEFDDMWTKHAQLVHTHLTAVKNGTVKYKQFHMNKERMDELRALGYPTATYDGIAIWEAATLKEIFDCVTSPECVEHVRPDDARFLAEEKLELVAGDFVSL
ncbi:BetaGal-dom2 domain-containing protein [Mycena chlorophos]|uniref:BetaGal-dom2 domain-containing protein n=1 Tax=Mycena chlorophos TaxID=658473 RepID=A0A8H6SH78_MYCCL|nr:BetaGal-dom2 domain-containing protein [Mycena chlorophos]